MNIRCSKQFSITPAETYTDITPQIQEYLRESITGGKFVNGLAFVYSKHTTACISLLEHETLLKKDMDIFMEKVASSSYPYFHDDIVNRDVPPDERRNGYSHLRSMLMTHQVFIPVIEGELDLGKWQRVFYVEHDLGKEGRTFNICLL